MSDARVNAGAGRVAVVTGAARGIGQAIALRLAEAGHAMALGDVRPAEETAKQITNGGGEALSVLTSDAAMITGQTLRIDGGLVTL